MSPCAFCTAQVAVLFPEFSFNWPEAQVQGESFDVDDPFAVTMPSTADSQSPTAEQLFRLASDFLQRSDPLVDAIAPPPWEDEDDIFEGEVFDDERAEYQRLSVMNLTPQQKEAAVRQLMANEALRYPECTAGFLIALALTYRRILLDQLADPRDKVEVLRRVYSNHEPEWMTAEIVYLHFVLLDQCRYLSRPSANMERKEEILRWIFTDPELEDRPFSFKNCVKLVTGNAPELGAVYRRLKEELRPVLAAWLREALATKRSGNDRQAELFDM